MISKLYKIKYWLVVSLLVPTLSFADFTLGVDKTTTFRDVIYYVLDIVRILTPILAALAFIVFFWGLSKFILNSSKPDDIKNGRNYMVWAVIVLFVLLTFRAVIGIISNELEIGTPTPTEGSVLLPTR